MVTIQDLFQWGMDRTIPELLTPPDGLQINLGPGNKKIIPNTIGVGLESELLTDRPWKYPEQLPFSNGTVAAVHAYHFMEHFDGRECLEILQDIQRVLMPGGESPLPAF